MKKRVLLMLLVIAVGVLLAIPQTIAAKETVIRIIISAGGSGKAYQGGIELFNEKYKGKYRVEADTIAYESLPTRLMTQFVSRNAFYDVVAVPSNYRDRLWRFLEPLNNYVAKYGPENAAELHGAPELEELTYDQKLVGLPVRTGADVLYYRQDLLEKAGLKAPANLDELLATARKLTVGPPNQREVYGFSMLAQSPAYTINNLADFLFSQGIYFLDDTKTQASPALKSPEAQKVFEIIKTMYDEKLMPNPMEWTYDDNIVAFQQGKIAMTFEDYMRAPMLEKEESKVAGKMAYCTLPAVQNGPQKTRTRGGSWILAIDKNAKNKVAAYEFIKFMTGYEAQSHMATVWNNGPAVLSIFKEATFLKANPAGNAAAESFSKLGSKVPIAVEQRPVIEKELHDILHQLFLSRIKPQDVGKAMYDKINAILQN